MIDKDDSGSLDKAEVIKAVKTDKKVINFLVAQATKKTTRPPPRTRRIDRRRTDALQVSPCGSCAVALRTLTRRERLRIRVPRGVKPRKRQDTKGRSRGIRTTSGRGSERGSNASMPALKSQGRERLPSALKQAQKHPNPNDAAHRAAGPRARRTSSRPRTGHATPRHHPVGQSRALD